MVYLSVKVIRQLTVINGNKTSFDSPILFYTLMKKPLQSLQRLVRLLIYLMVYPVAQRYDAAACNLIRAGGSCVRADKSSINTYQSDHNKDERKHFFFILKSSLV